MGRFFEYEDNKMIAALADRLEYGQLQIYCVDSVDSESWYNKQAHPYWRVQRHIQYENYILNDVLPLMWNRNWNPRTIVTGCSFGAYHALNFAMRHPDKVTECVTMGGSFDIKRFLNGWYSEDVYFNNPPDYLATAMTAGATTTSAPCSQPASGTCAGTTTARWRRSWDRAASVMRCTCGATRAITIGRGGDPWRGNIWDRGHPRQGRWRVAGGPALCQEHEFVVPSPCV